MISAGKPMLIKFKTRFQRASFFFIPALLGLLLGACQRGPEIVKISGAKLGTTYHITVVADQPAPADLDIRLAAIIDRVDNAMSTYKAESELSRFNRAQMDVRQPISAEFAEVVAISLKVWRVSDGAFDPTVGPLVNLWGFGPDLTDDQIPAQGAIAEALAKTGFERLQLLGYDGQMYLEKSAPVALDLSAVAKGYAVDLIADYLEMLALPDYLVELGGEVRVSGSNPEGQPWRVAIETPTLLGGVEQVIHLQAKSLATSGDYRNYFERDGRRYSHTIDPRSGYPIDHPLASVTVIMQRCAEADAWSTAFMVMGDEQAIETADRLGIAVYMLVRDGEGFSVRSSRAFDAYLARPENQNGATPTLN